MAAPNSNNSANGSSPQPILHATPNDSSTNTADGAAISVATSLPGRPSHVTPPKYCLSSFSVLNIAGLKPQTVQSKVPYVEALLKDKNQLFFGLTETWLKGHTMAEVEISGYKIYRADRKGRKHTRGRYSGGVALYLRKDIAATSEQIFTFSNGVVEVLATYSDKENLLVAVIYRQPDTVKSRK